MSAVAENTQQTSVNHWAKGPFSRAQMVDPGMDRVIDLQEKRRHRSKRPQKENSRKTVFLDVRETHDIKERNILLALIKAIFKVIYIWRFSELEQNHNPMQL